MHLAYSVCKLCIVRLQSIHIELPVPSLSFRTSLFACKPSHASSQTGHCQLLLGNSTFRVYQRCEINTSDAFTVSKQITYYDAQNNRSIANPPRPARPHPSLGAPCSFPIPTPQQAVATAAATPKSAAAAIAINLVTKCILLLQYNYLRQ